MPSIVAISNLRLKGNETPILTPNDSDPLGLRVYIQDKELVWLIEPRVLLLNMVLDI
jgi:hypothetical protein